MTLSQTLRSILRPAYHRILAILRGGVRQWVIGQRIRWTTPRMGSLRRTSPISSVGGGGKTPCRCYIENFIEFARSTSTSSDVAKSPRRQKKISDICRSDQTRGSSVQPVVVAG